MSQLKLIPSHLAKRIAELNCYDIQTSEFQEEKLRKLLLEDYQEISRRRNFGRGTMHRLCNLVGLEVRFVVEKCHTCGGSGNFETDEWYPHDPRIK